MLFLQAQPGKEGKYLGSGEPPVALDPRVEGFRRVPDFALAREENQDIARGLQREFIDGIADGVEGVAVLLEFVVG